jgi:hypothetical protein
MTTEGADALTIEALIAQTRAAREALHVLVTRMQRERAEWEREVFSLASRLRLTPAQRDLFRDRLAARPRPR